MMTYPDGINTDARTIHHRNGTTLYYDLQRVRRWNIGRRKYVLELTGAIEVFHDAELREMCGVFGSFREVHAAYCA